MSQPDAVLESLTLAQCTRLFAEFDKADVQELPQQNMVRLSLKDAAMAWPDLSVRLFFHDDFGNQVSAPGRYNGLEFTVPVQAGKAYTVEAIGRANAAWAAANKDECSSMFVLDGHTGAVKLRYVMVVLGGVTRQHVKRVAAMVWRHALGVEKFVV